ncbi:unnamed protein product [Hermetia illucens]|uniref:SAP30-binding protein n=1 Tax=Hermetia illucens TaxID=343691 RepID=A0A7R8UAQ4_HERIL|nr:SAP30-binding protein [Hermetia illucens]CAD7077294.1 unnamed protein product [Hermetia illucens]
MSSRNSALASLTATYTDSENEEEHSDENSPETESSADSQQRPSSNRSYTPVRNSPEPQPPEQQPKSSANKALRLVSYNDDNAVSDDENTSPNRDTIAMEISEEDDAPDKTEEPPVKENLTDKYAHYGFSLPPEPKGKVPQELQDKIQQFYDKMRNSNMDMNKIIQERKDFRNPSIYEKLISYCDINEFGTNYPPEIYDPLQWGPESYYEELAKAQKTEMAKRQKERKEGDKADQAAAAAKKAEEEAKKRKSKWDQPAPTAQSVAKTNIPPPTLTSNVTGTKGTVISAFGSLPKKVNM